MFITISILIWFSLTVCDQQGNQTQTLLSLFFFPLKFQTPSQFQAIVCVLISFFGGVKVSCVLLDLEHVHVVSLWLTYDFMYEWSGLHNRVNSGGPLMVTCLPLGAHIKLTGGRSLKLIVVSWHNTPGYIFISHIYMYSLFVIHNNYLFNIKRCRFLSYYWSYFWELNLFFVLY